MRTFILEILLLLVMTALFILCRPTGAPAQYFAQPPFSIPLTTVPSAAQVMGNWNRFISDGNTAFSAFATQIAGIGATGPVPSTAIAYFNAAFCPSGWQAADGTAGSPDLRGVFLATATTGIGNFSSDSFQAHTVQIVGLWLGALTFGPLHQIAPGVTTAYTSGLATQASVGNMASGNIGTESRPKNIALLACMKT